MTRQPFKCTGTFDVECASWNRFAVGCVYDGHLPRLFYDIDDLIDHLRRIGGVIWSHAGGVYDMLLVLERARARGIDCQVDRSQHRVTRIVMGKLTLRDSYGLWPVPLDEICGSIDREVPRLPWKCRCPKSQQGKRPGCGGYCRISEKAKEGDPELESYVVADTRALYDGLHRLHEFALESNIELRGTLGQTAWVNAQNEIGLPDSEMSWHLWRHARRGDRGGRAAIIRPKAAGPGTHHDICNAYPAQLAKAHLPVGDVRELGARYAIRALEKQCPGMYTCTVNVPDYLFLPPLPWLAGGRLNFPTGRFTGTWTVPELAAAFERGVVLEACHAAMIWPAVAPMFGELVNRWYDIRRKVGRKTPLGQWIGRLPKALTGKFSERPERSRTLMNPGSIKVCLREGRCRNGCTGRCGAYEQLDLDGKIWAVPFQHLGESTYPQWSAYLRAQTRVQWLEQAERYGEDLCFGNTDSLWTLGRQAPTPLGDGLGEWEYQHAWCDLEVRSASVYAWREVEGGEWSYDKEASLRALRQAQRRARESQGLHDAKRSQESSARAKPVYKYTPGEMHIMGIPGIGPEDWKRGRGILDRGIVTFGAAAKGASDANGGLFQRRRRAWSLPGRGRKAQEWFGDRRLASNGVTYPVDAQVLREMFQGQRDRLAERISRLRKDRAKSTGADEGELARLLEQQEAEDPLDNNDPIGVQEDDDDDEA